MERAHGRRSKKLIVALEDYHLLGRHSCSDCSDRQRQRIGCKKPGFSIEGSEGFRLESPYLHEREKREKAQPGTHTIIRECPLGYVLRSGNHVIPVISVASDVENGALSTLDLAPWAASAVKVVNSERARCRESAREKDKEQSGQRSDSRYAMNALRGRRGR